MGDRFLLSRLAPVRDGQFARALQHAGAGTKTMRKQLAEAVAHLFDGRRAESRQISTQEIERLDKVLSLIVQLRAPVERDRVSREIEAIYGAEGTARVGLMIERLLAGLDVLGVERETALEVVKSVALDSVPPCAARLTNMPSGAATFTASRSPSRRVHWLNRWGCRPTRPDGCSKTLRPTGSLSNAAFRAKAASRRTIGWRPKRPWHEFQNLVSAISTTECKV